MGIPNILHNVKLHDVCVYIYTYTKHTQKWARGNVDG
jgi:hypothetical protein